MFPFIMLLSAAALVALAVFAWLGRHRPSVHAFGWLLASIALWLISIAGWSLSPSAPLAMLWFRLQFAGVAALPVWLLVYALQFTGRGSALVGGRILLLWPIPLLTVGIAWGPAFGRLLFTRVDFARQGGQLVLKDWEAGPWFFLHASYSFGLIAVSVALLVRAALRAQGVFRRQVLALLFALIPAVVLTLLNSLKVLPPDLLVTPMGFLLAGAAILWGVLRAQLTSLAPVARDLLIEQMEDGMLVLDERGRVVDCNPAMRALLGRPAAALVGEPLEHAIGGLAALREALAAGGDGQLEVALGGPSGVRHYDIRVRSLSLGRNTLGRLVVLRDITGLKQIHAELFALATTDPLTRLANRRQFFDLAQPQIALAQRQGMPLALLLYDVDSFKRINDEHGHEAGDMVLAAVAARSAEVLRGSDLLCRYGGEEFVALLVNTAAPEAAAVAERLRAAVGRAPVAIPGGAVGVTISVGVALGDGPDAAQLPALLRAADEAMYRAKRDGKDRVAVAGGPSEP